ncbi:MAG TPA: hypothetical protein QF624_05260 [Dehalococcoidia bacterium]|nr:hypothetical protein [Dehalococcoidia bacterium]
MRYAVFAVLGFAAFFALVVAGLVFADVTLSELRDVVIVVFGLFAILLLIALIVTVTGLWIAVRLLTSTVAELLRDPVRPALNDLRESARNVRGASEFMSDSAVHPVIRAVSVTRGIRRGLGLVTGLGRKRE